MFFNANEMWSQNNGTNANGTFKGTGIYMNSVDEQFSLGNSIWFENENGHLSNLSIDGTLLMGTNGLITNAGLDFYINEDGLDFNVPDNSITPERSVTWNNGTNTAFIGSYNSNPAINDDMTLRFQADSQTFHTGGTQVMAIHDGRVTMLGEFQLPVYNDTTRPNNPTPGQLIFNTDANGVQVAGNNGNWGGI